MRMARRMIRLYMYMYVYIYIYIYIYILAYISPIRQLCFVVGWNSWDLGLIETLRIYLGLFGLIEIPRINQGLPGLIQMPRINLGLPRLIQIPQINLGWPDWSNCPGLISDCPCSIKIFGSIWGISHRPGPGNCSVSYVDTGIEFLAFLNDTDRWDWIAARTVGSWAIS